MPRGVAERCGNWRGASRAHRLPTVPTSSRTFPRRARWMDYGPHYIRLGLSIWISLVGVVVFGTVSGSMLPFVLRRLGLDPATSSAPFVATLVDVTGLVIYFSVAGVILRGALL